jgi:hypothetical protein
MVLWIGSIIAAFICIAWLAKNFAPDQLTVQKADNELTNLQKSLDTACRMTNYWKNYYPEMNEGNLIISDLQVCIDSSDCSVVYYSSPNASIPDFQGDDIILTGARACTSIGVCRPFYFRSQDRPVFEPGRVVLHNATTCVSSHEPVTRCRLLMCNISTREYIDLGRITSINITRDRQGVFSIAGK